MKQDKEVKSHQYDVAAVMAMSGLKFWENNVSDNFEHRAARILTQMVKADRVLMNEYLDRYCIEAHEAELRRVSQRDELEKTRLPKRAGW